MDHWVGVGGFLCAVQICACVCARAHMRACVCVRVCVQLFQYAYAFNGDVSRWNTAKVACMSNTFNGATVFNSDISRWNVASVNAISGSFSGASAFNGDLSLWNVASVPGAHGTSFLQPLAHACVHSCVCVRACLRARLCLCVCVFVCAGTSFMFSGASGFNSDISKWNVASVSLRPEAFLSATLLHDRSNLCRPGCRHQAWLACFKL